MVALRKPQIDIDVHVFSYLARTGMAGVQERLSSVIFDFSFVIEAYSDDEQPENILGGVRVVKLDLQRAPEFPTELLDPSEFPQE